jgi:hypothetical protein
MRMTGRIEASSLHVVVSSDHPLAEMQLAEAIARVLSGYAIDLTAGLNVTVPCNGQDVPYVAHAYNKRFFSYVRAANAPSAGIGERKSPAHQATSSS